MLSREARRLLTPGKMSPVMAMVISGFAMLSLFALDTRTDTLASLHSLYVFPLVIIVVHCRSNWAVLTGLLAALTLQAITLRRGGSAPDMVLQELLVESVACLLMIVLASAARDNYHENIRLAAHDSLTKLLNRRSLHLNISTEIQRHKRYGGVFSIAMIDLDDFKSLNDSRGHLVGDEALEWMATILRRNLRETDCFGRIGGDEFAVLMPHTNGDECNAICRKLNEAIARDMAAAKFSLTASIGHATFEATPATINDALREADQALYAAKSAGKSCVQGAQNDNPIESPQPAQ